MPSEMAIGMTAGALTGMGLLICGLYQRSKLRASQSWQRITGTITKAEIVVESDRESTSYVVSLRYDYTVNGVAYTGQRIGFSRRRYARKKRAQEELARYPVNSSVLLYFDPARPADAVLIREYPDSIMLIASGIVLLGIVAAGLLYAAR